jgi:hypothetical protein
LPVDKNSRLSKRNLNYVVGDALTLEGNNCLSIIGGSGHFDVIFET